MPDQNEASDNASIAAAAVKPKRKPRTKPVRKQLPPFNVVLLDDDDHTYAYVIEMLGDLFSYSIDKSLGLAEEVNANGRVIVLTTHRELAELKRDQILRYGADPRDDKCPGSMRAVIEPAE